MSLKQEPKCVCIRWGLFFPIVFCRINECCYEHLISTLYDSCFVFSAICISGCLPKHPLRSQERQSRPAINAHTSRLPQRLHTHRRSRMCSMCNMRISPGRTRSIRSRAGRISSCVYKSFRADRSTNTRMSISPTTSREHRTASDPAPPLRAQREQPCELRRAAAPASRRATRHHRRRPQRLPPPPPFPPPAPPP